MDVTSHDYGWGWSSLTVKKKENKMKVCINQVLEILLGLHLCFDFREGQVSVSCALSPFGGFSDEHRFTPSPFFAEATEGGH